MKIIVIEHDRCSETDKWEHYVAPDEMTEEEIRDAIDAAQDAYLKAFDETKKLIPIPPYPPTHIDQMANEDITIREMKQRIVTEREAIRAAEEKRRAVGLSFNRELAKFKIIPVKSYEFPDENHFTAVWGHRHGDELDY